MSKKCQWCDHKHTGPHDKICTCRTEEQYLESLKPEPKVSE